MTIYVLMQNDYPLTVQFTPEAIQAFIEKYTTENKLTREGPTCWTRSDHQIVYLKTRLFKVPEDCIVTEGFMLKDHKCFLKGKPADASLCVPAVEIIIPLSPTMP